MTKTEKLSLQQLFLTHHSAIKLGDGRVGNGFFVASFKRLAIIFLDGYNRSIMPITQKYIIPTIFAVESSEIDSVRIADFIESDSSDIVEYQIDTLEGELLPKGLMLTDDGTITGKPDPHTARFTPYESVVIVRAGKVDYIKVPVTITVYQPLQKEGEERIDEIQKVLESFWKTFDEEKPLPDIGSILERDVTPQDIYHLLGQFATLIIWNADDLSPSVEGQLINVAGISDKFQVHDFGPSLIITPKKLFDGQRSLNDAIISAKAIATEIQKRKWNIDIAGFDKMISALWVEIQHLNEKSDDFQIKVPNYDDVPQERDRFLLVNG